MTPSQFVAKWAASNLGERQGAQSHFRDLCLLLGRDPPADTDSYTFEKGAEKTGGAGKGFADVWRRNAFACEYKGRGADLGAALRQLQAYALDLQNPPYPVSDMARIEVHTNWTNTVSQTYRFTLDDLLVPETLNVLRQVLDGSDALKPGVSPQELTAAIAKAFGALGRRLQERRATGGEPLHHPRAIAHFLNRIVFCMFAEDARLLPEHLFTRMVRSMQKRPAAESARGFDALFAAMRAGGMFGADVVRWFNGGLFDDAPALPLDPADLKLESGAHAAWSLGLVSHVGVGNDPRYTPSTTFETFPFPEGLTPNLPACAYADDPRAQRIAEAAAELNARREAWLNPADLVRIEPEVVPGYPDRILPRDAAAAAELKTRTLTNLYNARPAWLDHLHRRLDAAVAAAYGWTDWGEYGLPAPEILTRLFTLNQERAAAGR